jgi:ELWxxDGT repeat protein
MSANRRFFLSLLLVCLVLLPTAAAGEGSVGPLQHHQFGSVVTSSARAGSLAYLITLSPVSAFPPQPPIPGFMRTDGTPEGTFSLQPLASRLANSHGNLMFFTCAAVLGDLGLCRSDGTAAGTFQVTQGLSLALDSGAVELPVTLSVPETGLEFFSAGARSASTDFELWATDGTSEGTRLVEDINPEGASNPRQMTAFAGRLFFLADTPQGRELWSSDGTPEGTERVQDFHEPGTGISLAVAGGALFVLVDSESGLEVWRSDGTEAGTARVLELSSRLRRYQAAGRHLFFVTRDAGGQEMWAIDGAEGEAIRVLETETFSDLLLLPVGDHVAFPLEDDHGMEPWWSDGTPHGTRRIADICPGPCSSFQRFAGTYGGRAVLLANDGVSGTEPWLTDGTAAGTFRLGDFCSGECDSFLELAQEVHGWLVLVMSDKSVWVSDGTPDGAWTVGSVISVPVTSVVFPDRIFFASSQLRFPLGPIVFSSLPVTAPPSPPGEWLESARVPGFRFKVRIDGQIVGRQEPACPARTLCVTGALPGRSEVFLRVSESDPAGRFWPSAIKLTTSSVEVWAHHIAGGHLRYYRLESADPAGSILEGILDRDGFEVIPGALELSMAQAKKPRTPQPPGRWIESKTVPGFRVQARITSNGKGQIMRREACSAETFCLSGATPGVADLLVRVSGPKPNKYFWTAIARFAPATMEVWVQQRKTGKVRYYRLEAPPAGSSELDGFIDRLGFKK